MAKINGTAFTIINGSDSLLHSTNCTLNLNQDLPDTTNKGSSGWAEHINGVRDWSIDFEGMYDIEGSGMTINEIIALIVGRTADAAVKFTPDAGSTGWTGNGTFQNVSVDSPAEQPATFSGTIVGNGALSAI